MSTNNSADVLREFYAVTIGSTYHVTWKEGVGAEVMKIGSWNRESKVKPGECLPGGEMLSVGQKLIKFIPEGSGLISPTSTIQRDISMVNTHFWSGGTSPVVGLFADWPRTQACACACLHRPCDDRWKKDTSEILRLIGDNHPYFTIPSSSALALLPPQVWRDQQVELALA